MPLYCAKHLAQLLEEYPPFEYPDEPEPAADAETPAKARWRPNTHPGPLLVAGERRPNGAFTDIPPFYARTEAPEPPPRARVPFASARGRATDADASAPPPPWLTRWRRRSLGLGDPDNFRIRERRNVRGGFWFDRESAVKT